MLLTGDIIPYMNGGNAKWRWLLSLCVRWLSPWCVWIMSTEEFIQQNTCKCASNMTEHTASRRNMRFVFCNMSHCISQVETHHRAGWHKGIFCARRGKIHKRCRRLFWTSGLLPQQNINSQPGNTLQLHLILSVFDVYSESDHFSLLQSEVVIPDVIKNVNLTGWGRTCQELSLDMNFKINLYSLQAQESSQSGSRLIVPLGGANIIWNILSICSQTSTMRAKC